MSSQSNAQSSTVSQVMVYVRRSDKSSVKMFIPALIQLSMLAGIVQTETSVHQDDLTIFYQGKAYSEECWEDEDEMYLTIVPNSIVHVRDARKIKMGKIMVTVEVIKADGKKGQCKKYQVDSSQRIGQFLLNILQSSELADLVFFVDGGRVLSRDKTFHQEYVEDGSIVSLVVRETPISRHLVIKLKNLETKTSQPENKKVPPRQLLAENHVQKVIGMDFQSPSPNFKKKKSSAVCVLQPLAASTNLGRWQSQKSEDSQPDKLATSLRWKKVDDRSNQKEQKETQKLTPTGKSQLKEEFRKLFQLELPGEKEEEKKSQPPSLNIFEEDESDEFIFEEDDQEEEQHPIQNGFSHSAITK